MRKLACGALFVASGDRAKVKYFKPGGLDL